MNRTGRLLSCTFIALLAGGVAQAAESSTPVHAAMLSLDRGRYYYQIRDFAIAAKHFEAALRAVDLGLVDDASLGAQSLYMLTHTYYPHLMQAHADQAVEVGRRHHAVVKRAVSRSDSRVHVVCQSALHLAKIYIHCGQYENAGKLLQQDARLSDAVGVTLPVLALDISIQRTKLAKAAGDDRTAGRHWAEVKRRVGDISAKKARGELPLPQAVGYLPVLVGLAGRQHPQRAGPFLYRRGPGRFPDRFPHRRDKTG